MSPVNVRVLDLAGPQKSIVAPTERIIFNQDFYQTGIFFVASGMIALYEERGDKTLMTSVRKRGEVFGIERYITGVTTETAQPLVRSDIIELAPDLEDPQWKDFLFQTLATQVRERDVFSHRLKMGSGTNKVAGALVDLSLQNPTTKKDIVPLTQSVIGQRAGTYREMVLLELKRLELLGVVSRPKKEIEIVQPDALRKIAAMEAIKNQ